MRLELLKAYSNLLNTHSEYGVSCSIYIMKADWVPLRASMMSLEQPKKMRQTRNQPLLVLANRILPELLSEYFECT